MKQIFDTFSEGKDKKDPSRIKMEEVRHWFRNDRETLKTPSKLNANSYVAPGPGHELQIDLLHVPHKQPYRIKVKPKEPDAGPRVKISRAGIRATTVVAPYGLMAVDVFTKKMHVAPLENEPRKRLERGTRGHC